MAPHSNLLSEVNSEGSGELRERVERWEMRGAGFILAGRGGAVLSTVLDSGNGHKV